MAISKKAMLGAGIGVAAVIVIAAVWMSVIYARGHEEMQRVDQLNARLQIMNTVCSPETLTAELGRNATLQDMTDCLATH